MVSRPGETPSVTATTRPHLTGLGGGAAAAAANKSPFHWRRQPASSPQPYPPGIRVRQRQQQRRRRLRLFRPRHSWKLISVPRPSPRCTTGAWRWKRRRSGTTKEEECQNPRNSPCRRKLRPSGKALSQWEGRCNSLRPDSYTCHHQTGGTTVSPSGRDR